MEERRADSGQAKLVRQLKARLEDTEQERGSVVRQRRNLELELLDTQEQLEQRSQHSIRHLRLGPKSSVNFTLAMKSAELTL